MQIDDVQNLIDFYVGSRCFSQTTLNLLISNLL